MLSFHELVIFQSWFEVQLPSCWGLWRLSLITVWISVTRLYGRQICSIRA